MKSSYILIPLCLLAFFNSGTSLQAQTTGNEHQAVQSSTISQKIEGTYQIQVVNSRNQPRIPFNIEETVINNRQASEIKYLSLGTEVRLMILPLSTINAIDFKPLERIAYIRE